MSLTETYPIKNSKNTQINSSLSQKKDPNSFRNVYGFRFNGLEPNLQREANSLSVRLENSLTLRKGIIALAKIKLCLLQIKSLPKKMRNSVQVILGV
ncbi:hypothetical protein LEP1GSC060_0398, partial [Leptospira weilii serovar Ranarum str. ICFT]